MNLQNAVPNRLLLLAILLFSANSLFAAVHPRVALVIGNSQYQSFRPLQNPYNDAQAMAQKLQALGFTLLGNSGRRADGPVLDLDEAGFQRAVRAFAKAARDSDIAFVYYAGHGLQVGNESYLLPVDAAGNSIRSIQRNAMSLETVLRRIDGTAELTVAVIDACREIPDLEKNDRIAGSYRGLARVQSKGRNRIVAFSSAAGQLAEDGADSEHSPYTAELLKQMDRHDVEIGDLFRQVAFRFARNHGGQEPEVLIQGVPPKTYYLAADASSRVPPAKTERLADNSGNDEAFWSTTLLCGTTRCFDAYLQAYPNGRHAADAREQLARTTRGIGRTTPKTPAPPSTPPPPPPTARPDAPVIEKGFLQVISNVRAVISLDDKVLGTAQPHKPLNINSGVPVGDILIRASAAGQSPKQQRSLIKPNAWSTVVFQFQKTAAPAASAPPPPPPPPPRSVTASPLSEELKRCQNLLEANKLAVGRTNAISCYRGILRDHPDNTQAKMGLREVEGRYAALAERAIERNQPSKARTYISRLETLNPRHSSLAELRRNLKATNDRVARQTAAREQARRRQEEEERRQAEEERLRLEEEEARFAITQCLERAKVEKQLCGEREQRKLAECKSEKREIGYMKFQAAILTEYPEKMRRYDNCVAAFNQHKADLKKAMARAVMDHQVIPELRDPRAKQTLKDMCGNPPDKPVLEDYLDLSGCKTSNVCDKEYQQQVDICSGVR